MALMSKQPPTQVASSSGRLPRHLKVCGYFVNQDYESPWEKNLLPTSETVEVTKEELSLAGPARASPGIATMVAVVERGRAPAQKLPEPPRKTVSHLGPWNVRGLGLRNVKFTPVDPKAGPV